MVRVYATVLIVVTVLAASVLTRSPWTNVTSWLWQLSQGPAGLTKAVCAAALQLGFLGALIVTYLVIGRVQALFAQERQDS